MTSYLERLKAMIHENSPHEQPPKPPKPPSADAGIGSGGFGGSPDGSISGSALPSDISRGVQRLKRMQPVGRVPREIWRTYAADALWLVDSGVAADAMGQGWTALDLFGIASDEQWQSLAAWIGGRRDEHARACILLREMRGERCLLYAVQALTSQRRWHYPEPAPADAMLPWTM